MKEKYGVREFLQFVIPSVASMLVFSLYAIIDGIFVAKGVGEYAVAAVNISMPYSNIMFGVSVMLAVGTSTICSILIGRGQLEKARKIATQNTIVVAIIAIILTILAQLFMDQLAYALGASADTKIYVIQYLRIISLFSICYMVSYCFEVLIKADGHPRKGAVIVITCSICNAFLDYLFIFVFKWGIQGAAFATGLAQLSSLTCFFLHFHGKKANIKPLYSKLDLKIYCKIIKLGIPDFLNEMSIGIMVLLYNRALLITTGTIGIVAFTVVSYAHQLIAMLATGVAQGMQPLVSYYYGKENVHNYRGYYRMGLITAFIVCLTSYGICNLFPEQITSLILKKSSPSYLYTITAIRKFTTIYLVLGINLISAAYFTATASAKKAITISLLRGCILICISTYIITNYFGGDSVWYSAFISELSCLALTLVLIVKNKHYLDNKTK